MSAARRPGGTGTIVEVLDAAALRDLVPEWEALAQDAVDPNPFYEHWMLLPALQAFGAHDFRCIAVWESGTLAGLFPVRRERFHGLPVRGLGSWRHRNMRLTGTPLVHAKFATRCLTALLQSGHAPLIQFDWVPAGGLFFGALADAAAACDLPWIVTDAYTRAILVRERDPRERFNSNMKNNLRRWQSRLAAYGKVAPVRLAPDGDVAAWTEEFTRLEASGWKGRAGSAVACRPEDRRFVTEVFAEAFRRGRLHISGLDLDGRPLTRHCLLVAGEGSYTFKIAYDETYEKCSPGILGEVENVRQFMETPGPGWIDSNTARENTSYGRVWKDRRTVQRVAVGVSAMGRTAVAALPLFRLAVKGLRAAAVRVGLQRRPPSDATQAAPTPSGRQLRQAAQRMPVS